MSNLKIQLFSYVGDLFLNNGFVFNKSEFKFTKRVGKSKAICHFGFYDYKPSWLEFDMSFEFDIFEIENELKNIYKFIGEQFNNVTFRLNEGDLHPETKELSPKFRNLFHHRITNIDSDIAEFEDCKNSIVNLYFPLLNTYMDLENFKNFIINNKDWVLNMGFFPSALAASKLKGPKELKEMAQFLWSNLNLENKPKEHFDRRLIEGIIEYEKKSKV